MRYTPDGLTVFFRYEGVVRRAVKLLKYHLVTDAAASFVACIPQDTITMIIGKQGRYPVFVPVPLHPRRQKERGFNQAEVLCRHLSACLHMPVAADILRRTKRTVPQVEMRDRKDRLTNMSGVFAVRKNKTDLPDQVFLVDDVFTTGATVRSAANALKRAGVKWVWVVTMAR